MPAPSMIPPAAITGTAILRDQQPGQRDTPSWLSGAAGSKTPRWPPAS